MALKSTICGLVHYACRTQAHYPTMVSSFKLSLGAVSLPRFCRRVGHIEREESKICGVPPDTLPH